MVTMPPNIYAVMDSWGQSEMRNNSQAALFLIQEGLKNRGLLPGDEVQPAPTISRSQLPEPKQPPEPDHPNYPSQPKPSAPKGVEPPQALKFRIRDNYFQLLNNARLTPTRLKELALGAEPTKTEIDKIEKVLAACGEEQ